MAIQDVSLANTLPSSDRQQALFSVGAAAPQRVHFLLFLHRWGLSHSRYPLRDPSSHPRLLGDSSYPTCHGWNSVFYLWASSRDSTASLPTSSLNQANTGPPSESTSTSATTAHSTHIQSSFNPSLARFSHQEWQFFTSTTCCLKVWPRHPSMSSAYNATNPSGTKWTGHQLN